MTALALGLLAAMLLGGPPPAAALHAARPALQAPAAAAWRCPMCVDVRRDAPGRCPRCGMALVSSGALPAPRMPGLPRWLLLGTALAVLVASVVVLELRGPRPPGARRTVLDAHGMLSRPWLRPALRLPVVLLFLLVVAAGLLGNPAPDRNLAPVLTWTIWWATLVGVVLVAGKAWCTVCPWMALADWVGHVLPRLERPWPRALRSVWPATALFVALTWLELGWGVTQRPRGTALLGVGMFVLALGTSAVFQRKAFCRYACLVGRVSGLYATFAASELRAADPAICRRCATRDCLRGNARGAPCPTGQYLGAMRENTYCTLCLACARTCPHGNVVWRLRPFGADLLESIRPRRDEAYLALTMVALSAFHGLTMTATWDAAVEALRAATGLGWLAAFSAGMAAMLVVPLALYAALAAAMAWCAGGGRRAAGTIFVRFAYALVPIALFYHLAHNTQHVLFEGAKLLSVASDPFGWGWDLLGTAATRADVVLPVEAGWLLQAALVVTGHVYALAIAHRTAYALDTDRRRARAMLAPLVAALLLFSAQSLWLLGQPMVMRTAL
jgi:polyferredoxin